MPGLKLHPTIFIKIMLPAKKMGDGYHTGGRFNPIYSIIWGA